MPERKGLKKYHGASNKILSDLVNRHAAARGSRDHLHETLDFIRDETKAVRRGVEHDVEVVTEEIAGGGRVAQAPEWDWLCRGDEFDETADRGEHAPRGKSMKAFLLDAVPHNTAVACGAADSTDSDSDKNTPQKNRKAETVERRRLAGDGDDSSTSSSDDGSEAPPAALDDADLLSPPPEAIPTPKPATKTVDEREAEAAGKKKRDYKKGLVDRKLARPRTGQQKGDSTPRKSTTWREWFLKSKKETSEGKTEWEVNTGHRFQDRRQQRRFSTDFGRKRGPRLSVIEALKGKRKTAEPPLTPALEKTRSEAALNVTESGESAALHSFSLRQLSDMERVIELTQLFQWMDVDGVGVVEADDILRGAKKLAETAGDDHRGGSFSMSLDEIHRMLDHVPRKDTTGTTEQLKLDDFVSFGAQHGAPAKALNAHRKISLMLNAWLVRKRLKRYNYENYDELAAVFYETCKKAPQPGRMSAVLLHEALQVIFHEEAYSIADCCRIIDGARTPDGCVDIDQFLGVAEQRMPTTLATLLRRAHPCGGRAYGRKDAADKATLYRLFWEYDVEDSGEIDGRQFSLALEELALIEKSVQSERMKQIFDVSGCNSPILFYDLYLFQEIVTKLRSIRTRGKALALYNFVCRRYRARKKPVPLQTAPPPALGDLPVMISLNTRRHELYDRRHDEPL
ncbi:hypothetical protein SO694_001030102 [Aureococcus anophagefferens]|uniref:Calmodulin n=1 Tax=Aureococcus anophagefferens TaxID=44056 RepID=A0ABR1FN48_AURAN